MRIGIVGSGNVGGTLGKRWEKNGHEVIFGGRDPESLHAVAACEVVVLAVPWDAVRDVVAAMGDLSGKIVIDATNPLLPGLAGLSVGTTTSAAEQVAEWAAGARVVKAFNTVGSNVMDDPKFGDGKVALFYCGDYAEAKHVVKGLVEELGFEALDAGPLKQARVLEPFAMLWISLAVQYGYGREIAFHLMRR